MRTEFENRNKAKFPSVSTWVLRLMCVVCIVYGSAHANEVWLSPLDPVARAAHNWNASEDYMDLFRADSEWKTVAANLRVFKIGPGFVQQGRDEDLQRIFSELKRRNIKLALEIGMATRSEHCQERTEAYGEPGLVEGLLQRVKRLGGEPSYIAMDEPLYYGHEYQGGDACRLSVRQVAADVAPNVKLAKRIFPNVKIGDIEVVYASKAFLQATEEWVDAYREAVGFNLEFLHADVSWSPAGMANLPLLSSFVRKSRRISFGIIYNGGNTDGQTDQSWARAAADHFTYIESGLGVIPDQAVFQTWVALPSHNLPEATAGTLTNLVLEYLRPRSVMTLMRNGTTLSGRLSDSAGAAISGAPISIADIGAMTGETMPTRNLSSTAFKNARAALFAVRANKELQCTCSGPVTANIGKVTYYENAQAGGGRTNVHEIPGGKIAVDASGTVYNNSAKFPVTPGAAFTLEVPYEARINVEHSAYVAVLFVDDAGHEVGRRFLYLESIKTPIGTVRTRSDGSFSFGINQTVLASGPQMFSADFPGDDRLRSATAMIQ
ncbi:hypothetical protein [Dyella choica]|uniref:Uncharacterized protein n=1 Tax=Dyella choica TaxID=1927959 RepID=A0A3S0WYU1_9GAMM|nr:hypothetical protein [Dyella choica]RUL79954.1 hypothetical protein EKH80_01815 [Dyella choica]